MTDADPRAALRSYVATGIAGLWTLSAYPLP
jgi:hypothetical protein